MERTLLSRNLQSDEVWKNCSIICGYCHESEQCHHINGTCINGCASGYQGAKCTEECDKHFGPNCIKKCNKTCKSCDKLTGICNNDCHPGWRGLFCHELSKLTVTEKKLTSEFNGILSAFCILVFLNGVVIAHFLVKRFRNSKAKLPAINQSNIAQNGCESEISNVYINDNDISEYQELGEISKLETYDTLQDVPYKQFLWHVFFLIEEMMVYNVKMSK